jgi:hypothetical protein
MKDFIPYNLAYQLYELGFDEPCLKYQWIDQDTPQWMHNSARPSSFHTQKYWMENDDLYSISIPTFSQAFRWFREKHNLPSNLELFHIGWDYVIYLNVTEEVDFNEGPWNTYEEAELACLKKLIEIVKNK